MYLNLFMAAMPGIDYWGHYCSIKDSVWLARGERRSHKCDSHQELILLYENALF